MSITQTLRAAQCDQPKKARSMKRVFLIFYAVALSGCSTLNNLGIGGPPGLLCNRKGEAVIDDRLFGPDAARLAINRRFADGDPLCPKT